MLTRGKVLSWEYRSPRKRNSHPPASVSLCWVSWVENVLLIYYASSDLLFFYIGKIPGLRRFWTVTNLHTRLAIVTANKLGLAFPRKNLPKKFRPDPSTFYCGNKQTDRQTYASDYIIPRESFRGDNKKSTQNVFFSRMRRSLTAESIPTKFCTSTPWGDIVIYLTWHRNWLRGFGGVGVRKWASPIDSSIGF